MSLLENFVASPLAAAIGWTLLHSLWEGALLSALLAAVLVATRSPRIRYAVACAAMLLMLGAFSLTLILLLPQGAHGLQALQPPAIPGWNLLSAKNASSFWNLSLAAIAPWLAPRWLAGVLLLYLRSLESCLSVQRLRRRGVCSAQDSLLNELVLLSARLRVSRPVLLLESSLADVPVVLGHFKPLILVPVGLLAGLPPGQIEAILLHELAHIRRHDFLINVLQRLVEGLFFYHPAVWWISHVMRAERECCCDDLVVAITGDPHEYALTLAALEQFRLPGREPAVAITGGRLMKRIRRLLYSQGPNGAWAPWFAAAIFIVAGAVSLAAWQSEASTRNSSAAQAQADKPAASSYSKWLNEDVVYIIDDAERAAFQKLTTNEERDKFIEQFWARRNSAPGAPDNKFKQEHYRRIAFANQRFTTASGTPGWQTDRGHIYIVYGPPDEIDSHLKSAQYPVAIEVWTYRHVDGVGNNDSITFIDRTGRGDYHLAPSNSR
ncbi:MAG: GWxTD domain-containing protein [Candidatus Acidiferrum sp.]